MYQQTGDYRHTTGYHLWMAMALALTLGLSPQVAVARECHRETPLPADVRLIAPGPQVPEVMEKPCDCLGKAVQQQGALAWD